MFRGSNSCCLNPPIFVTAPILCTCRNAPIHRTSSSLTHLIAATNSSRDRTPSPFTSIWAKGHPLVCKKWWYASSRLKKYSKQTSKQTNKQTSIPSKSVYHIYTVCMIYYSYSSYTQLSSIININTNTHWIFTRVPYPWQNPQLCRSQACAKASLVKGRRRRCSRKAVVHSWNLSMVSWWYSGISWANEFNVELEGSSVVSAGIWLHPVVYIYTYINTPWYPMIFMCVSCFHSLRFRLSRVLHHICGKTRRRAWRHFLGFQQLL